ncbi:MAG: signal recognition particle protein [[Lactobacillus] timonensis]|jgi:signal recognition particle subunit SRP54|uniref:signal recognition particle protein n=1 Tax=[Lactobacillus] timonensis TaxID=1970790 RepID=UPI002355227B|nr:signal recognition particle protein [[Lactobacillus] timonensis]MCI1925994.1 signal recognition particle protein [[Lactobacillus] timonensis]MCI1957396.1 signal recognition particle protein [[Lactobacillus] timonensis]MCI1970494.1 signal recognition particle protein [[Lactobacillus] timonensis]MCI2006548.1 signal recognition particle protein [[Lactobacillus] timonensis]
MAFEGLTERLQKAMEKLRRKPKVTEADLRETMREIRLALLDADVNFAVVKDFVKTVRKKAMGAEVLKGLNPAQQIVKIVNDELTKLMGDEAVPLAKAAQGPTIIMMVGLQGAGKTTTAGKLALRLKDKQHARPLFIAADVYRPAAITQLKQVASSIGVPVFDEGTDVDPVKIVEDGLAQARDNKNNYVIIDTAGRLQIDEKLMDELARIKDVAQPNEILLVVDAMTGQNAVNTAEGFDSKLDITGVVLTKLDGDTRGGAAMSIRAVTGKPIKFVGEGEKMDDLDIFHPDRMASRILGMGDMMTLIEKAQQNFDEEQAQETMDKMRANTFDYNDFVDQLDQVNKMGSLEKIMKMIPGVANNPALQNMQLDPKQMGHMKAIVMSMTPEERQNPDLMNPSRRRRLVAGAGRPIVEVNRMIKQFNQMRKMMKQVTNGNMSGMANLFGGQMPGGKMGQMAMNSMARNAKKAQKRKYRKLRKLRRRR